MPSKEQKHGVDVAGTKQRSPKPAAEDWDTLAQSQTLPVTVVPSVGLDPHVLASRDVLRLQRLVGNQTVVQLLAQDSPRQPSPVVQPKLMVGPAGDSYEQEADRMAEQVMSMPTPANAPSNATTVRKLASAHILQRALWANRAAKFRSDNGSGGKIPNSEYKVNASGYLRYAPINKTRALEQVFHEGPRSFVYLDGKNIETDRKYDAVWEHPIFVTKVTGDKVTFKTGKAGLGRSPEVTGNITPTSGATVFDFGVDDTTKQLAGDSHVGHPVEDLGQPLPTLDDPDALQAARDYQNFLLEQYLMLYQQGKVTSYKDWNKKSLT